jgi:hypothetical protein
MLDKVEGVEDRGSSAARLYQNAFEQPQSVILFTILPKAAAREPAGGRIPGAGGQSRLPIYYHLRKIANAAMTCFNCGVCIGTSVFAYFELTQEAQQ